MTFDSGMLEGLKKGRTRRWTGLAILISLVSLIFSAVSLYETFLKRPTLAIFTGCNWQYGRGPGSYDEYVVIPVTVANLGARNGIVLALELAMNDGSTPKIFDGKFTRANVDDKTRQLFAPLAIAGRQSATASVVFVQRQLTNPPLVNKDGFYRARLAIKTSLDTSYGLLDRLFGIALPDAHFGVTLTGLDIGTVLNDANANLDACAQASEAKAN